MTLMHRHLLTIQTIGLDQHEDAYAHRQGHVLDHIYTSVGAQPGPCSFISDYRLIADRISIREMI